MTYKFEDVIAWQKAHAFVLKVYKYTNIFPAEERFGLVSQFKRAAVSIEANIAEGYKKISKKDKLRFYNTSQGSIEECRDYIILGRDLGYISPEAFDELHISLENASKCLVSYCEGIIKNSALQDTQATVLTTNTTELLNYRTTKLPNY